MTARRFASTALVLFPLLIGGVARAQICENPQALRVLKLTTPAKSKLKNPVSVQFQLEGDVLHASFEVKTAKINGKPVLGENEYPFQFDVVELFLSVGGQGTHLPYYEIELSPFDQTFYVRVDDVRKPFVPNVDIEVRHDVERTATGWKGHMSIPLLQLGWDRNPGSIKGNAYSVLGVRPNRSYWSLFLPLQKKPNFHTPQFFKPLLNCEE